MVMVSRGLALSLCLAMASVAQAQVDIELVPRTAPPYVAGQRVRVEALITQTTGANRLARLIQFDTNATDPGLNVLTPTVHDGGTPGNTTDDTKLWDFRSTGCEPPGGDGTTCGNGYLINGTLTDPVAPGLGTAWIAFTESTSNPTLQIPLENGVATKVAEFEVEIPAEFTGCGIFDVVNAAAGADGGAKVHWGFGAQDDGTITRYGASQITGGSIDMCVNGNGCTLNLVSSAPDCDQSLWRSQNNFMVLSFDGPAAAPAAGEIQIREMLAGGAYGPDLSGSFTFTPNGNDLRIDEVGAILEHRKWYAVFSDGTGANYCEFERDHPVQVGDANGDGRVVSFDVSVINGGIPCFACPDDRRDINGDNRLTSFDVSITNGSIPSFPVAKPDGHGCLP